jgi:hypothetical protein
MITTAGPLLTTAVLAGTLVFQIYQAQQTARETHRADEEKRQEVVRLAQAAEQARFTDALKLIQTSERIWPAATLLNTFTQEPQRTEARRMAVNLLLRVDSMEEFRDLFSSVFEPIAPADLPTILDLNRDVASKYTPLGLIAYAKGSREDTAKMDQTTKRLYEQLGDELAFLTQKATAILQDPKADVGDLDLRSTMIYQADMRGVNFRHANLTSASFNQVNLDGCDLGEVTEFQFSIFRYSPWWHAARISKPMLDYLEETAPYSEETFGRWSPNPVSATDYATNLQRLKSSEPR